eukprot:Gb_16007 [translate_table: standard]
MAVGMLNNLLDWVRRHPLVCLALPCSTLLLLIPPVLSIFLFFSPLLLSTSLFTAALLNVRSPSCSKDGNRVLFESIFKVDQVQEFSTMMAVKDRVFPDGMHNHVSEISEVTNISVERREDKSDQMKVSEQIISDFKIEEPNSTSELVINGSINEIQNVEAIISSDAAEDIQEDQLIENLSSGSVKENHH